MRETYSDYYKFENKQELQFTQIGDHAYKSFYYFFKNRERFDKARE